MFTTALVIIASGVAFILTVLNYFYGDRNLRKLAANFPGPLSLPFIGDAYLFVAMDTEEILCKLTELCATYRSTFRIWLGYRLVIVTFKLEEIKIILNSKKTIDKPDLYDVAKPWAGNGLLTAPNLDWHRRRKIIQPTFNQKILQTFVETFQKKSTILTDEIASNVNGKEFDISEIIAFHTLNFICETTMGTSIMTNKEKSREYFEAIKTAMEVFVEKTKKIWLKIDFIFNLTELSTRSKSSLKLIHQVSNEVIQKKRKEIDEKYIPKESDTIKRKPFLDLLMIENKLSDEEIRDEVITTMFAGHDTNAITSCFVLLMLASHPDIQEQVYEEIYSIYGFEDPKDLPVKPEDLQSLIILERVIKETMRIFPIIPHIGRLVNENLEIGDKTLPKNSIAVISIWTLHRDENLWPDPFKFNPDRFLPEEVAKRPPYSYIPFSGGPRNCIGMTYAMMAVKVLLTTILRKYILKKDNIRPVKDFRLQFDILLRPAEPITLRLENRIKNNL